VIRDSTPRDTIPLVTESPQAGPRAVPEDEFTIRQRISLWLISSLGYLAIRLICATVRFSVSTETDTGTPPEQMPPPSSIATFWHRCVFSATYFFRRRGISVMTSSSFDGEYIARISGGFGFDPVRGSSSRGGMRALLGMHTVIEREGVAAFTIDGPRGPVYVAKPGPVLLARNTAAPIYCFYVAVDRAWILNSWDRFMIPKPFARAHIRWSAPIVVPRESGSPEMAILHDAMQQALERVRLYAESEVASR